MKKYEGVLERVRILEEKRGISYAKTDGKLYKTLKVLFTIFFSYTFIMNLMFIMSMFLLPVIQNVKLSDVMNLIITVSVCSVLALTGFILTYCRKYLVGGILTALPMLFSIPSFALPLMDDLNGFLGFKISFYWRHFGPIVVTSALIIWMTVIAVRANTKTDRMYKKVCENLFNIYKISEGEVENITEEQWTEFLANYNPNDYKGQFVKEIAAEKEEVTADNEG